jgi:hypothetical protein
MNFALALAANKLPGISVAWAAPQDASAAPTITSTAPTAEELRLESLLVAGGLSESTRTALLNQFEAEATAQSTLQPTQAAMPARAALVTTKPLNAMPAATALERQDQLLAGLLLGSPEFQRR